MKALFSALLFCAVATAQTGVPVLPANSATTFQSYGATAIKTVAVKDPSVPFTQAVQVELTAPLQFSYDASVYWNTVSAVQAGDFLLVSFWVRNVSPATRAILRLEPKMQIDANPYSADLDGAAPADGTAWRHYAIPVRATINYPTSNPTSSLEIFFGNAAQKFQIGGVGVLDFGVVNNPIPPSLISQFAYYYPDRGNPKAAWRTKALSNIETYRKSNLTVQVTRPNGTPVSGATVTATETNPAFLWGSAVDSGILVGGYLSPADTKKYIHGVLSNFNTVVFESDLKWPEWLNNQQLALDGIAWVQAHGLPFRGHNLIWPSWGLMPDGLQQLTPAQLSSTIDAHFQQELGTAAGGAYQWDIVNEPYDNYDVQGLIGGVPQVQQTNGVLGNPIIAHWYQEAHQIDPSPLLHVNDYSIFENQDPVHLAYDVALVKYIQGTGGEVDGVGFESHFGQGGPVFSDMDSAQSQLSGLVKEFGVTEFDFASIDPSLQHDLTDDFLTYVFGSPQIGEFLMWGFWDGAHWLGDAPIYNLDWTLKPSGKVFQTLTHHTWRSNAAGATDAKGNFTARVFQGTYTLSTTVNGAACTATAKVTADSVVTIACP